MGLDMYLSKRIYVGANYEHNNVKGEIKLTRDKKRLKVNLKKVTEIIESVGYWRKANHIHKWFVNHIQDGEDDCREYYVSKEQLEELLKDCEAVLKDKNKAKELLETQKGFFFGGTDYDKYYFDSIKDTIKMIKGILRDKSDGDYYYRSSW
jgi:hypothetical protein